VGRQIQQSAGLYALSGHILNFLEKKPVREKQKYSSVIDFYVKGRLELSPQAITETEFKGWLSVEIYRDDCTFTKNHRWIIKKDQRNRWKRMNRNGNKQQGEHYGI